MKYDDKRICRYCGEKIDYFFIIHDKMISVETWITTENQRRADAYPYGNGYKVTVRCPKPLCNKINSFEYDCDGNYIGELE